MICPWRIDRRESLTMPNEYTDTFCRCVEEDCPCYKKHGNECWCYREQRRFPLNISARKGDTE